MTTMSNATNCVLPNHKHIIKGDTMLTPNQKHLLLEALEKHKGRINTFKNHNYVADKVDLNNLIKWASKIEEEPVSG